MHARVLAVYCKLHFDSHTVTLYSSDRPTGRDLLLHATQEISLVKLLYRY